MRLLELKKSNDGTTKYTAVFQLDENRKKEVRFGATGYKDFIQYSQELPAAEAEAKRNAYVERHKVNENWSDPTSKDSLARFLLWNKRTLAASLADYKRHFGL